MTSALIECRLLDGPNLYFPRPAAKVTLDVSALLTLDTAAAEDLARVVGLASARPGPAGTAFRQRYAARWVTHLVRRLARAAGYTRLAVRSRSGGDVHELVVAYPWRRAGKARAMADGLGAVLAAVGTENLESTVEAAVAALSVAPNGSAPELIKPRIPVAAITGTNGKTTTSRMLGHIARVAGRSVGWSSTDGVFFNGDLVEEGDFSGPSGAGQVLGLPGVQLAVTETARGGILRRGVGVASNDVSVVTNISADHLGLGGIDTLDQLAEVKAVITKITKPGGWCVLNADDPRTFAMRLGTRAQIWVFTRDPESPHARTVLDEGGRVTTVLDGWIGVLASGRDPVPVVPVIDIPMTLAGLSQVNVENALAACSAALALGFTEADVAAGLTSFDPAVDNPGRMNVWTLLLASSSDQPDDQPGREISVVIDLAHNEAGLDALFEIMNGIKPPGARLLLGVGTAGDRGDDVFVRLGEMAALNADVVEIVHKSDYLRGREQAAMGRLLREGAAHAGLTITVEHDDELTGLRSLVAQAQPGDVVAVMAHQDRAEIDDWLITHGGSRDDPPILRTKVRASAAVAGRLTDRTTD